MGWFAQIYKKKRHSCVPPSLKIQLNTGRLQWLDSYFIDNKTVTNRLSADPTKKWFFVTFGAVLTSFRMYHFDHEKPVSRSSVHGSFQGF